jgi:hypothetical protein
VQRLRRFLRATTANILFVNSAAAAQFAIALDFAAFARCADCFGLAAGAASRALSTCPLRSDDRHRLTHHYSDQAKINGDAN